MEVFEAFSLEKWVQETPKENYIVTNSSRVFQNKITNLYQQEAHHSTLVNLEQKLITDFGLETKTQPDVNKNKSEQKKNVISQILFYRKFVERKTLFLTGHRF